MTYKFEESISNEMKLPDSTTSLYSLNAAYAVLVKTLDEQSPGFGDKLLGNLDKVYEQNEGQKSTQLAIAQIGIIVKTLIRGQD